MNNTMSMKITIESFNALFLHHKPSLTSECSFSYHKIKSDLDI